MTTFDDLIAAVGSLPARPADALTEIKATLDQWAALRQAFPASEDPPGVDRNVAAALYGLPVVLVEDVRESTAWMEGWLKCPHCRTPVNGHPGDSGCDAFVSVLDKDIVVCVRPPEPYAFTPKEWLL